MHRGTSAVGGSLPLFVFPTSLSFFTDEPASHQQVLTVYNPYNFTLRYKVLSTTPKKYRVVDAEGCIKPRCCVDIYIKHKEICVSTERIRDKFRLQVTEQGQKTLLGRKDIASVLLPTREQSVGPEEQFESLPATTQRVTTEQHTQRQIQRNNHGVSWVVLLTAVLCVVVLMLPTHNDDATVHSATSVSGLVEYFHVSIHQKLIAAYILGLVTMVVLRS